MVIPDISRKTNSSITSIIFYVDPSFSAEVDLSIYTINYTQFIFWLRIIHKKVWIYSFYRDLIRILNLQSFSFPAY